MVEIGSREKRRFIVYKDNSFCRNSHIPLPKKSNLH